MSLGFMEANIAYDQRCKNRWCSFESCSHISKMEPDTQRDRCRLLRSTSCVSPFRYPSGPESCRIILTLAVCLLLVGSSFSPPRSTKQRWVAAENEEGRQAPEVDALPLGVYTLTPTESSENRRDILRLDTIKSICQHNARVSAQLQEVEKASVWELLVGLVDSRLLDDRTTAYSGGAGNGALGSTLVQNVLRYYESLGDVQMLSTIVCVLSGGNRRFASNGGLGLLRPQDAKYDNYIRKYADLLYSWGLLATRVELKKHLVHDVEWNENTQSHSIENEEGKTPGLAIAFRCPQCGKEAEFGTNVCSECQAYAFRCVLCDNAVRGTFTVCDKCQHGGHVGHVMSWFAEHDQCPTGCGCVCKNESTSNIVRRVDSPRVSSESLASMVFGQRDQLLGLETR